jgi:TPR repeat protein
MAANGPPLKNLATLVALLVSLAAPVIAGPWEDADAAYKRGDYSTAFSLARPLAEHGDALAQSMLGRIYRDGHGVPQDYAEAASWFRKAADQDSPVAQFNLGFLYLRGLGVPQDNVQAHMWFNLAAVRFPGAAPVRDFVTHKMTPAQIEEAQKLAREWKPKVNM